MSEMMSNPIIKELHEIRQQLSDASGDDIRKIAEAANARQEASGKAAVSLPPRKVEALRRWNRTFDRSR